MRKQKFFTRINTSLFQSCLLCNHYGGTLWNWRIWRMESWLIFKTSRFNQGYYDFWSLGVENDSSVTLRFAQAYRWVSATEVIPFWIRYTICTLARVKTLNFFILRWIPMGFTSSLCKERITERYSSLVHCFIRFVIFKLLLPIYLVHALKQF